MSISTLLEKSSGEPERIPTPLLIFNFFVLIHYDLRQFLRTVLASHSSLGDQNNRCAYHEDRTNNVEHSCAHAAG